jgi:hypothetical protein
MKHLKLFESFGSTLVREVANKLISMKFIDSKSIDIEDDHLKINSIKGKQFSYFLENYLIVEPDNDIDGEISINIWGGGYDDEVDQLEKEEVYHWIYDNWHTSNYIINFTDTENEDFL